MTRRFPSSRPGDDRFDELDDPALAALIADARAAPVEADRGPALETALAVFRVAAAPPTVDPTPEPAARATRRHRLLRAVAATTLATKVLLGVATAAAIGGIGVAVTETVHHISPRPPVTTAPVTTPPPSGEPTGTGGSDDPTPSGSTSTVPTASPTTTVTDTASIGASGSTSPSRSSSPTGSRTSGSAGPTRSSPPPSASPRGVTPSPSATGTGDR